MDDLTRLKLLTDENDTPASEGSGACGSCAAPDTFARMFTDEQLMQMLELHDGDVRAAAYDVLIRKDGLFVIDELKCLNPENLK